MLHRSIVKYDESDRDALMRVFDSGQYVNGFEAEMFESDICDHTGANYCVTVNSGSTALMLAYHMMGIKRIVTTPYTFHATANVAAFLGIEVDFVDINDYDYCICPKALEGYFEAGGQADAVVVVHLFGNSADLDAIEAVSPVPIIEDCAQAFGTWYKDAHVGTNNIGCFSLYPTKNLSCAGDGGFITCNTQEEYETLIRLRDNGRFNSPEVEIPSGNFRLSEFQAAIANNQLSRFDIAQQHRNILASYYNMEFNKMDNVTPPFSQTNVQHTYHIYPLYLANDGLDADEFIANMNGFDIGCTRMYEDLLCDAPFFDGGEYPVARLVANNIVGIPMSPHLTWDDVKYVVECIQKVVSLVEC